jgi:hypothetical protein
MELSEIQKKAVTEWVIDGLSLSDIQKKIGSEFDIPMTYMDVRLLVIDLDIDIPEEPEPEVEEKADDQPEVKDAAEDVIDGVVVDVDAITRPGAIVSGTVVFSDGVKASWFLDQSGRLALDAGQEGYKPSEDDLKIFQQELRDALKKKGF